MKKTCVFALLLGLASVSYSMENDQPELDGIGIPFVVQAAAQQAAQRNQDATALAQTLRNLGNQAQQGQNQQPNQDNLRNPVVLGLLANLKNPNVKFNNLREPNGSEK